MADPDIGAEVQNRADRPGHSGRPEPLPGLQSGRPLRRSRHAPELRKAHQQNDRAVMQAYGFSVKSMTESSCVAELMKMYQKLVDAQK